MFFATYLRRELRRRMRQAIFVALGLAVGIGLVVTVSAASAGVKKAESSVLASLYGVGTDVTVTGEAPQAKKPSTNGQPPKGGTTIQGSPNGATICQDGKCENAAGKTISSLAPQYLPIKSAEVADVARLHDVAAAAGGLLLTDNTITFPKDFGQAWRLAAADAEHGQRGRRSCRAHRARPAERGVADLRPLVQRRRLRRPRRRRGLRLRDEQQPEGRLDDHGRQREVQGHRHRPAASVRQPARRLHPAGGGPGARRPVRSASRLAT